MLHDIEHFENEYLQTINPHVFAYNLMTEEQRKFVNGIVRKSKPKKILELGVCHGGSSVVLLNAIKDNKDAIVYSIDYTTHCFNDKDKKVGWVVDHYATDLTDKWRLYTNGLASDFLDEIGGEIDMCLIDTVHANPGELLDYLMVLPFLKNNAIIVLHDISLHIHNIYKMTNCILFSAIRGQKFYPKTEDCGKGFPNIGAVVLDSQAKEHVVDIFMLLALYWSYIPTQRDYESMMSFFTRFYDMNLVKTLQQSFIWNTQSLQAKAYREEYEKHKKAIKKKYWYIPTRALRNKLIDSMWNKKATKALYDTTNSDTRMIAWYKDIEEMQSIDMPNNVRFF